MLLVVTDDGKLLLHHRDDVQGIPHPDCWAGFGGAVEEGEHVEAAVRREVREEIGVDVVDATFLVDVVDEEGDGRTVSLFYVLGGIGLEDIDLHEGAGVGIWSAEELREMKVSPFVRRAITQHLVPALADRRVAPSGGG